MSVSNFFGKLTPKKPHLLRGTGGLQAAVSGLRSDINQAFVDLESFVLPSGVEGGELTRNSGDPDHVVDIAPVLCADDTGGVVLQTTSVIPVDIEESGVNGLDTGTVAAHTWYSVWAIRNSATGATGGLFSLSQTSPTMPAGFDLKRRLGWYKTDASANLHDLRLIRANGREREWSWEWVAKGPSVGQRIAQSVTLLSTPAETTIDFSPGFPPGITDVLCFFSFASATGTNYCFAYVYPPSTAGPIGQFGRNYIVQKFGSTHDNEWAEIESWITLVTSQEQKLSAIQNGVAGTLVVLEPIKFVDIL